MDEYFDDSSDIETTPAAVRVIPPRSPFLRLFVDYNPFYVLSAMCMLFGVFALNNSFTWSPIPAHNLLTVLVMINVYEAMLIVLAVVLLKRNIRRDASLLMLIEAFFLADVGFLNIEVFGLSLWLGLFVNAIVLTAAVAKVAILFRAARVDLFDGRFAFVLAQLAILFAVPGFIAIIGKRHDTFVHPLAIYAGWWLAGPLPVVFAVLVGSLDIFRPRPDGRAAGIDRIISRVLLVLPMLSIIAHLSLAHWVYKVIFHPLDLAPLLLGMAVAIGHCDRHVASLAWRMRMQLALPFVAVAMSAIKFPPSMVFALGPVQISPLRIALAGATVVYLDGLWLHRHVLFAWAAGMSTAGLFMGHSVRAINDNSMQMAQKSADAVDRLIPKTLFDWGVVSIAAAFVLLGLGALISFTRRAAVVAEEVGAREREDDGLM
jgi:hypothetical protein